MRLNAYLARAWVASRRGADELIKAGRVKVNDEPGQLNKEVSDKDLVTLDDKPVQIQTLRYILLYKPAGTVTTLKDPQGRRKVTDLVDIAERVIPVGRLDYDTSGALLLTNDGELAHKLMHPSFEIDKVYEAEVKDHVTPKMLELLSSPILLEDGPTAPAKVRKLADNKIELIIHEGRKHQVKHMLAAVSLPLKRLHRSKYDSLNLSGLNPGQWRDLTTEEVAQLKQG